MEELALFALPRDCGNRDASTGATAGHEEYSELNLDFRALYEDGKNPALHIAAFEGLEAEIQELIEDGTDINAPGPRWGNVLTAAIIGGHPALVQ